LHNSIFTTTPFQANHHCSGSPFGFSAGNVRIHPLAALGIIGAGDRFMQIAEFYTRRFTGGGCSRQRSRTVI
jgi:hypothetical protein